MGREKHERSVDLSGLSSCVLLFVFLFFWSLFLSVISFLF